MAELLSSQSMLIELIQVLRAKKGRLGFAESCTGGLVSSVVTRLPGVSDIFMGSIISYSNDLKVRLLNVSPLTLNQYGAVSEITAKEMALGALSALKVNWAVAVTGIAGPTGGTVEKPVGTVCFAVMGPSFEYAETIRFSGDRETIQNEAAAHVIKILSKALNSNY